MEAKEDSHLNNEASSCNDNSEDDWEAVADRAPDELLVDVSTLTLEQQQQEEDNNVIAPVRRRGRGNFTYQKHALYSDRHSAEANSANQQVSPTSQGHDEQTRDLKYGTHHALVLEDFQPSMTTSGLENMLVM
ncbi:uncharacterized protein LOC143588490 [Bidens hawaiensis]|uniref:uncharacterized protein LOC143588490 n=1 Tax=Bidens hawaiensis TaxID=980011 RepID=UPI004049E726